MNISLEITHYHIKKKIVKQFIVLNIKIRYHILYSDRFTKQIIIFKL